jgi:predicted nuclease of predicted toxin-antitoxin system
MRILLDECVDQRLRRLFAEHECETAAYAKLSGLKNGLLLAAAEAAGFEVIVTTDQGIPYQQNLHSRQMSIIILCAATNRRADLEPLIRAAINALASIKRGADRLNRLPPLRSCPTQWKRAAPSASAKLILLGGSLSDQPRASVRLASRQCGRRKRQLRDCG